MKESLLQKDLIDQLYKQGAFCFNIHGHQFQKGGMPDVLVLHPRFYGFIELKTDNYETETRQKSVSEMIKKRLFPAFVLRGKNYLQNIYKGHGDFAPIEEVELTIEDFYGNIIARPANMGCVLSTLQELVDAKKLWEQVPKIFMERLRDAKAGDTIYLAGKELIVKGNIK